MYFNIFLENILYKFLIYFSMNFNKFVIPVLLSYLDLYNFLLPLIQLNISIKVIYKKNIIYLYFIWIKINNIIIIFE